MDGNRGAKGSIKDRLISMLYRLRYAKKVKKEEEYTIVKKEKQVEYLKKLVEVRETENIDILDSNDKKKLDKVKVDIKVEVNEKNYVPNKQIDTFKHEVEVNEIDNSIQKTENKLNTNSKGIENSLLENENIDINLDLNLKDIEYKNSELDSKVNLKEEIKKTKNEVVILKEVDKFIEDSKETLNEISNEVESLKKLSKEKNQDTKDLEDRYKKLKEKVEKLKKQYDTVKNKYDLSEFSILESIKLIDNITDYKSRANLNEMDMMIKVCKKEMAKIDHVTIEYKETKKVGSNIDKVKKEQKKIKIKFHKSKENIKNIDDVEQDLNRDLKTQEEIIDDMYKEASYFEKVVRKEVSYTGYGKLFSSLLRIAGGILTLPFSGSRIFGVALGNTMINRGLRTLNRGLQRKEKIIHDYKYTDIAYKISEVKDKVEYTNLIISDNLNEIEKLRENFRKYKEYNKVLPEYEGMLNKIDKLEEKLKLQQVKISKMNKKLEEEEKLNKEKMKKVVMYTGKY